MAAAKKSPKKTSVKSLIVQPYGVEVIVSSDWEALRKHLIKKFKYDCEDDNISAHGLLGISFTIECQPTGEVKFVQFAEDEQTLVHECVHTAWHVLDHVGIKVSADNHEALAYTTDWIYGECKKWLL